MTAIIAAACCCREEPPPPPFSCFYALRYCYGLTVRFKVASTLQITTYAIGDDGLPCFSRPPVEDNYQTCKFTVSGPIVEGQDFVSVAVKGSTLQRRTTSVYTQQPPGQVCPIITPCALQEQTAEWQGNGLFGCGVQDCPIPPGINQFNPAFQLRADCVGNAALRFEFLPGCCAPGQGPCVFNASQTIGGLLSACFFTGCNYPTRCPSFTATFNMAHVVGLGEFPDAAYTACNYSDSFYSASGFNVVTQTGSVTSFV